MKPPPPNDFTNQQFDSDNTPLEFPCAFPIKAMGRDAGDFAALVEKCVREAGGDVAADAVRQRPSSSGNFLSVTVTVTVGSREQLDGIYRALHALDEVLWTL